MLDDPLQDERLEFIINGNESSNVDGLLTLVKSNQSTDSRRSYQAIKTLVNAANKSQAVKERLLRDPDRWQWAVNWLKGKMNSLGTGDGTSGSYWTFGSSPTSVSGGSVGSGSGAVSSSTDNVLSNEDASTRTFHRTTSAQVILEEANAMLAEFDRPESNLSMMSSPDQKLAVVPDQMDTDHKTSTDDDEMPDLHREDSTVPDVD